MTAKAEEAFYESMLQTLSYIRTHTSETAERLATGVTNNILEVGTKTFDTSAAIGLAWGATCGSILVYNPSDYPVIVQPGSPGVAPIGGAGVSYVGAGTWRVVPVASRTVALYGTAGQAVGYQAFTNGGFYGSGLTDRTDQASIAVTLTGANQQIAAVPFNAGLNILVGTLHYRGFTIAETAAAAAKVRIWDNTLAAGRLLDTIPLTANQGAREHYAGRGKRCNIGIFVEVVSGAVEGSVSYDS